MPDFFQGGVGWDRQRAFCSLECVIIATSFSVMKVVASDEETIENKL